PASRALRDLPPFPPRRSSDLLIAAADGHVLTALRETADNDAALIGAVDRLSRKLRERIGESLKSIRAAPPLEQVTTASIKAASRSEEHTSELQSRGHLVCRLL